MINRDLKLFPPGQFATFLSNHDQPRVMQMLADKAPKAKVAASLLMTMPGVPFIYYGEEIGMLGKKPDELIRTPFQWSADREAGFTSGTPWEPVNSDYSIKNVSNQSSDSNSLLQHYKSLISLRAQHAALRVGDYESIHPQNPRLISFLRTSHEETVMIVINMSGKVVSDYAISVDQSQLQKGTYQVNSLLGSSEISKISITSSGGFDGFKPIDVLQPYETIILQLSK